MRSIFCRQKSSVSQLKKQRCRQRGPCICGSTTAVKRNSLLQKSYHVHTREASTSLCRKAKLHFAQQCFTADAIRLFTLVGECQPILTPVGRSARQIGAAPIHAIDKTLRAIRRPSDPYRSVDLTVLLKLLIILIYSGIGSRSFFPAAIFLPLAASSRSSSTAIRAFKIEFSTYALY